MKWLIERLLAYAIIGCVVFFAILTTWLMRRWMNATSWDPFGYNEEILTTLRCKHCNFTVRRRWQKGDYMLKITDERCPLVCKSDRCKGKMKIIGIYWNYQKTPEEIKWEKEDKKWR